jgi:hypothetical protein
MISSENDYLSPSLPPSLSPPPSLPYRWRNCSADFPIIIALRCTVSEKDGSEKEFDNHSETCKKHFLQLLLPSLLGIAGVAVSIIDSS